LRVPGSAFTPYQRRLFIFLSVATFFEGYDFMALSQILPELRSVRGWGLSKSEAGNMSAVINLGTVVAYLLVRYADTWGRRRILTLTIAGYTVSTFVSGLAPDPVTFTIAQFVARLFLTAEWVVSMVYAAEEFPAERRGMVIGVISAFGSFGSVLCAAVVPLLLKMPYGWRSTYFVGIVPLALLAFARRNLKETARFEQQRAADAVRTTAPQRSFFHILRTPYRRRVLQLSLIWGLSYVASYPAVFFWKDFALSERGFSEGQVGLSLALASLISLPFVFYAGRLLDVMGRKAGGALIFGVAAAGVYGAYGFESRGWLTFALIFGVFGAATMGPVLNAFTTELFPTSLRGDAFAWSNNLIGRVTYVLSPTVVATIAETHDWGPTLRVTAVFPLATAACFCWLLPETKNRELEDTAAL
jgi:putative MFS transporter